ncbi:MAG: GIY-YIG nuclease family protein [Candidatus Aminicenantes bacterium]|jgi:sugar fermentation stimulation protein A
MEKELSLKKKDAGIYVLVVSVAHPLWIKPGKLPEREFQKGIYFYIGRAKQHLRGRLARHFRAEKKLFWHVDYLLQKASIAEIWCRLGFFDECRIASAIIEVCGTTCAPIPGFGTSDCRCPSHLIYYSGDSKFLLPLRYSIHFREVQTHAIDDNPF